MSGEEEYAEFVIVTSRIECIFSKLSNAYSRIKMQSESKVK
jgi:hypothetical protein